MNGFTEHPGLNSWGSGGRWEDEPGRSSRGLSVGVGVGAVEQNESCRALVIALHIQGMHKTARSRA